MQRESKVFSAFFNFVRVISHLSEIKNFKLVLSPDIKSIRAIDPIIYDCSALD